MMLTVRLDGRTQKRLSDLSRRTGRTRSEIVREALQRYMAPPAEGTAYDHLRDVIGIASLGGGRARRSEELLRALFAGRRQRG